MADSGALRLEANVDAASSSISSRQKTYMGGISEESRMKLNSNPFINQSINQLINQSVSQSAIQSIQSIEDKPLRCNFEKTVSGCLSKSRLFLGLYFPLCLSHYIYL